MPPVDPNEHDRFVLRQRLTFVINRYEFSLPSDDGDGQPFCFVEQARFKFKEDIRFYADETKATELLRIKARQRFDPKARYDVTDGSGAKVGEIQKVFGKSLLRSTYRLYDAGGEVTAVATEHNAFIAFIRRFIGLIPFIGGFTDWVPIPYDFVFVRGDEELGVNRRRRWKFTDIYDIDLTADAGRTLDRRLVLASVVGMDALQAR